MVVLYSYRMMIEIRKLAALDIVLHGARAVLIEFAAGVLVPLVIGLVSIVRDHAMWARVFGAYLLSIALNYIPLFIHASDIIYRCKNTPQQEAGDSLKQAALYTRQSFFLVVPLVIPLAAAVQELERRRKKRTN